MAIRKQWYKAFLNVVRSTTEFTFTNDRKIVAELSTFSDDIQLYFALHGMKAKFGDLIAPAMGKGFSVDEAADFVQDRITDMAFTGDWNKTGEMGTPKLIFRAMVEHLPTMYASVEAAATAYENLSKGNQTVIREHLEIKELVKKYQLETATKRVEDAEDLVDLAALLNPSDDDDEND